MKKLLYIFLFVPLALFGQDEYSLSFDGEDDYVEISNSLDFDLGDFTIIFKFKTPSITPNSLQGLVSKSCSGCEATLGDWFISYNHTDSGRVMLFTEKGGLDGFVRTGILALDTWYNIGVRRIESTGELFITSNIIGAITDTTVNESGAPTGIINNTESFVFGNMMTTASPYEFEGFIDDVSLWNFNMSYQTMKDYMSCSPSGFEQGLVGYWNFNEGQGNKLNDISGNENHGVINGATYTEDVSETCSILDQLNQSFDAWNLSIDLAAGWNMFGYGCPAPIDLVQALSEHTDNIIILKDNNGKAYMPEFGFNGIGDLTPGLGYQIKVTEAIEGFSLCDWYVNDIPEDNIVSLQEENASLQAFVDSVNTSGCIDSLACNYQVSSLYDDGSCEYSEQGFDCDGNLTAEIGDEFQGGLLFYIDETGQHGLVVGDEFNGSYYYGCDNLFIDGAMGYELGSGNQNTIDIVLECLESLIAASICYELELSSYNDWYLPSIDELFMIWNNVGQGSSIGNIGNFTDYNYWSSTQVNTADAKSINFGFGTSSHGTNKGSTNKVVPIRSF